MDLALLDYHLPEHLIAAFPAARRDESRLLVVPPSPAEPLGHRSFRDIIGFLRAGDLLVVNDSRVIPARLVGRRPSGGVAEILLLEERSASPCRWEALVKPGRRLREGDRIILGEGRMTAHIESVLETGERIVRFEHAGQFLAELEAIGSMPLPPYILKAREKVAHAPEDEAAWSRIDHERYQTVYAAHTGSIAAPTAGLHFTRDLLDELRARGVELARVTLHVGAGTFKPITESDTSRHVMHTEEWSVPAEAADAINAARRQGRRVVAVGTTSVRTLESAAGEDGLVRAGAGRTALMIAPGYHYRIVDALITNFHLPRSTLLLLVSALVGRRRLLSIYEEAVAHGYRFYSYGDAMFLPRLDGVPAD